MRPLTLTFSGLRSYRDTTTIDFSQLDLFAVIGDTGAGKSTLIEALSLALYAKKSWTGGPAGLADMIADGVNTMRVELRFQADGNEWIVTRARHRNAAANVDKLTSPTGGGPNVDGAKPVTERITELVGLDHDQFTRAVVLPQGRFDLLLRATEKQRTEILSSILGLGDIAATREHVVATRDVWNERAVEMRLRRANLPADPAGDLAAATSRAAHTQAELAALRAARDVAVDAERRATEHGRALELLRRVIDAVPSTPHDPAAELGALHDRAVELHAERSAAAAVAATADAALGAIDGRLASARDGFTNRDRMAAARAGLVTLAHTVEKDLDRVASLTRELAAHTESVPPTALDAGLVRADEVARASATAAVAQLAATERSLREATDAWRAVVDARATVVVATQAVTAAAAPVAASVADVEAAAAALAAAEQRVAGTAEAERATLVAGAVATVAGGCTAGDDCPVCARPLPVGFVPPALPEHAAVTQARLDAEADVAARRAARDVAVQAATRAEHDLAAARSRLDDATSAGEDRRRAAQALGLAIDGPEDAAGAPFAAAVATATAELDVAVQAQEAAAAALTIAATTLDLARRAHAERATAIEADLDAARVRSAEHAAFVARLPASWQPALDQAAVEDVLARLDEALGQLDGIEAERDVARQAAADGHARVNAADGLLSREVAMPLSRLIGAVNRRAAALRDIVAASEPTPSVHVPGDLPDVDGADLDALAVVAAAASEHTASAPFVLAAAERVRDGLAAEHDAASRELVAALGAVGVGDVDALHAALGRAESELDVASTAVAAAAAAASEAAHIDGIRDVLDPFVANLKVLSIALRDQHFVAHLVRARETELLAEATRRLKDITGGRFGFTTGFGVVSIASGEVRTPDTLSGGERFQAALALALGLVEIASRGGGKLDAVFVDEGFGSLDSTALDTALETLGKVAGGGKMVALISHLRPVAEYVDTVLHVTRDDVLGSRIDVLDSEAREQLLADDIRARLTA